MRFLSNLQGCIIYPQAKIMVSICNKLKIGTFLLIQYLYQRALYTNHNVITYSLSLDNKIFVDNCEGSEFFCMKEISFNISIFH